MFKALSNCLKNMGSAYELTAIIGDCFCPSCDRTVKVQEPKAGDFFFGQCVCGRYIEAKIELSKNGQTGKFIII